jgi:hypothetical protein
MKIEVVNTALQITQEAYFFMTRFEEMCRLHKLRASFSHLRPQGTVGSNPRAWWKYAFECNKLRTGRRQKKKVLYDWKSLLEAVRTREKYASLFLLSQDRSCPWSDRDQEALDDFEIVLSIEEIVQFRKFASEKKVSLVNENSTSKKQSTISSKAPEEVVPPSSKEKRRHAFASFFVRKRAPKGTFEATSLQESGGAGSDRADPSEFARSASLQSFSDHWDDDDDEDAFPNGEDDTHNDEAVDIDSEVLVPRNACTAPFELVSLCTNVRSLSLSAVLSKDDDQASSTTDNDNGGEVVKIVLDGQGKFSLWSTSSWTCSSEIVALRGSNFTCAPEDAHKDIFVTTEGNIADCAVEFDPKGDGSYSLALNVAPMSTCLTTSLVIQMQEFFTLEDGRQNKFMKEYLASFAHAFDRITPKLKASIVFKASELTLFNDDDNRGVKLNFDGLTLDNHTLQYESDGLQSQNKALGETTLGNTTVAVSEILRSNHWSISSQSVQVFTFVGEETGSDMNMNDTPLVQNFNMNFEVDVHLAVTDVATDEGVTIICIESTLTPLKFHVQPQSMHCVLETLKLLTSARSMKVSDSIAQAGEQTKRALSALALNSYRNKRGKLIKWHLKEERVDLAVYDSSGMVELATVSLVNSKFDIHAFTSSASHADIDFDLLWSADGLVVNDHLSPFDQFKEFVNCSANKPSALTGGEQAMLGASDQMSMRVSWTTNIALSAADLKLCVPSLRFQWNPQTLTQWSEKYLEQFVLPQNSSVLKAHIKRQKVKSEHAQNHAQDLEYPMNKSTKFAIAIDQIHGSFNYADCCTEVAQFDIGKFMTSIESVDKHDVVCNMALGNVQMDRSDRANSEELDPSVCLVPIMQALEKSRKHPLIRIEIIIPYSGDATSIVGEIGPTHFVFVRSVWEEIQDYCTQGVLGAIIRTSTRVAHQILTKKISNIRNLSSMSISKRARRQDTELEKAPAPDPRNIPIFKMTIHTPVIVVPVSLTSKDVIKVTASKLLFQNKIVPVSGDEEASACTSDHERTMASFTDFMIYDNSGQKLLVTPVELKQHTDMIFCVKEVEGGAVDNCDGGQHFVIRRKTHIELSPIKIALNRSHCYLLQLVCAHNLAANSRKTGRRFFSQFALIQRNNQYKMHIEEVNVILLGHGPRDAASSDDNHDAEPNDNGPLSNMLASVSASGVTLERKEYQQPHYFLDLCNNQKDKGDLCNISPDSDPGATKAAHGQAPSSGIAQCLTINSLKVEDMVGKRTSADQRCPSEEDAIVPVYRKVISSADCSESGVCGEAPFSQGIETPAVVAMISVDWTVVDVSMAAMRCVLCPKTVWGMHSFLIKEQAAVQTSIGIVKRNSTSLKKLALRGTDCYVCLPESPSIANGPTISLHSDAIEIGYLYFVLCCGASSRNSISLFFVCLLFVVLIITCYFID